jgi:hypothetical protein
VWTPKPAKWSLSEQFLYVEEDTAFKSQEYRGLQGTCRTEENPHCKMDKRRCVSYAKDFAFGRSSFEGTCHFVGQIQKLPRKEQIPGACDLVEQTEEAGTSHTTNRTRPCKTGRMDASKDARGACTDLFRSSPLQCFLLPHQDLLLLSFSPDSLFLPLPLLPHQPVQFPPVQVRIPLPLLDSDSPWP